MPCQGGCGSLMSVIADLFNRMRLSGLAKSRQQVTEASFNTSSFKGGVRVWEVLISILLLSIYIPMSLSTHSGHSLGGRFARARDFLCIFVRIGPKIFICI